MCALFCSNDENLLEMALEKIGAKSGSGFSSSSGQVQREVRRVATPYTDSNGYFKNEKAVALALEYWLIGVSRMRLETLGRTLLAEYNNHLSVADLGKEIMNSKEVKPKRILGSSPLKAVDAHILASSRHPNQDAEGMLAFELERLAREQSQTDATIIEIEQRALGILLRRARSLAKSTILPPAQWTIALRGLVPSLKQPELDALWHQFQGDVKAFGEFLFSNTKNESSLSADQAHDSPRTKQVDEPPPTDQATNEQHLHDDAQEKKSFQGHDTKLEAAFGFGSGRESYGQLLDTKNGKIVYAIGTAVYCHDKSFFLQHEKRVTNVHLSSDGSLCASADTCGIVRLFRIADTLQIGPPLAAGLFSNICNLGFCKENLLIIHGISSTNQQHLVVVLNTANGNLVAERLLAQTFLALSCHEQKFALAGQGPSLLFFCSNNLEQHTFGRLASASVKKIRALSFCSLVLLGDANAIAGSDSGNIFVFRDTVCLTTLEIRHKGPVQCLALDRANCKLVSAAQDTIKLWTGNELDFVRDLSSQQQSAPSLIFWYDKENILLTSEYGAILKISLKGDARAIVHGHLGGAVGAIAAHPTLPLFASTGEDRKLILWDADQKIHRAQIRLEAVGTALSFRKPYGDQLALGATDGALLFFSISTSQKISALRQIKPSEAAIIALRFGPPHTDLLAVATQNCLLFLFAATNAKPIFRTSLNNSLTHLHFGSPPNEATNQEQRLLLRGRDHQDNTLAVWALDKANSHLIDHGPENILWYEDISLNQITHLCPSVHPEGFAAIALLADNIRFVSIGHNDRTLLLWRLASPIVPLFQKEADRSHSLLDKGLHAFSSVADFPTESTASRVFPPSNNAAIAVSTSRSRSAYAAPTTADSDWPF
mmetsp:Transcript_6144/g.9147  ORF Transcript_6144/g.9147 Transcript_6144/m.9147 type:complete len:886 (+) Transcript_6144:24-2681(+)|eukprot:CAMPEP_0197317324 /NCGR_PEP_ID=MMETSP0891-20130614/46514_1 /TAXON_ID=44058 ORGANISM="Aureoumbra lagunensis, Strain CCMP1510" /NCGR_SAMPLE_ID=MMETSP0891 /ASSEMBLY_ACC=CAM_ASM_000534 /LENGTH=885 /DNA_ID=CAMNT_0042807263 /DNA_START=15 /DNA_END=2672 /DNA_ORIENTATION=-